MTDSKPKLKILRIDDDPVSLKALASRLEAEGYAPITADNAETAWQHLDDGVTVVITDLNLPQTKGVDVV
jgi:DNA-binding response OmpR family regulator